MRIMKQTAIWFSCGLISYCLSTAVSAAVLNKLQVVEVKPANNKAEVRLDFVRPVKIPKGFVLENPPRIVLDFPQVEVLPKARRNAFGTGVIKSVDAANNKGQARVVFTLNRFVNYTVEARGRSKPISGTVIRRVAARHPPARWWHSRQSRYSIRYIAHRFTSLHQR